MVAGSEIGTHFLLPGTLYAKPGVHRITTVLGSCVAICLWDQRRREGGMNHFKLPLWNGDGLPSPKFGNIATEKLLENLLLMGCDRRQMQAKVFGGAAVLNHQSGLLNVGERNIQVAMDMLRQFKIPVTAQDLGGEMSRKIVMDTSTGSILMKRAKNA
ncbi:CheD [Magnetococcus marinus MC-1]|uniref:Probable chemoreceptor glutamine deamidase CheD n=1 Tax=Magnetococcus marinus (strain ATCC BAA-1437 / JCM 17883 / MC-1) TaxID=156889 RepID=A0L6D2_MAGMM|nr:chemotaxis protein CheD [Magnetococcus marinus]ABK43525.1 CheD [Magnetococcus marinus MC-1]